jgi:hypothetical protein
VQRSTDDRCPLQPGRTLDEVAVRLLNARHDGLRRGVARLHDAAGCVLALDVRAFHRHDEVDAPGTEPERDRGGVEDDDVADRHRSAQVGVGDRRGALAVDIDLQLVCAGTCVAERDHDGASQADHAGPRSVHTAPL